MKYNDSIAQANAKMTLATKQLVLWALAANPVNYTICYEYVSGNAELCKKINLYLANKQTLDSFFMEELFQTYILQQGNFRDGIIDDMDNVLVSINRNCQLSSNSVNGFIAQLDHDVVALQSKNPAALAQVVAHIKKATTELKEKQQEVIQNIKASMAQTDSLKIEIEAIKKEIYFDPLTGLYNRKALNQHLDTWYLEDPDKIVATLIISIDHFAELNKKFGHLVGNVLLAKVAKKVASYVGESGLPVRTSGNEFLILLPGIEQHIAVEIADKIRQGVEKLRFISNKTGVRLPPMTISLGLHELTAKENIDLILQKSRNSLQKFQAHNSNKVIAI